MKSKKLLGDVKHALRSKYAWPGGYPLYVILEGGIACEDCVRANWRSVLEDTRYRHLGYRGGWRAICVEVLYEGVEYCCECSVELESAYGPVEEDKE